MLRFALCVAFLTVCLSSFALDEEPTDTPFPKLPPSAAKASREFEAALVEAAKAQKSAIERATTKFAEELKGLQKEATKNDKLEEAVALRDAARMLETSPGKWGSTIFDREEGNGPFLTLGDKGYRWSDWKTGVYGRWQYAETGGLALFYPASNNPKTSGKLWSYLSVTIDRKHAVWWAPSEGPVRMKAKLR